MVSTIVLTGIVQMEFFNSTAFPVAHNCEQHLSFKGFIKNQTGFPFTAGKGCFLFSIPHFGALSFLEDQ